MASVRVFDDMGRVITLSRPPARIVSLVPSETYNVARLGVLDRLVGRTRYCDAPAAVQTVPVVGGTKDIDVAAVVALAPDLILANQEENSRAPLEQLAAAGCKVFVSLPRSVPAGLAHLARLARIINAPRDVARPLLQAAHALGQRLPAAGVAPHGPRAFVPIWDQPLMTFNDDTYGGAVLTALGLVNVFAERLRLYPLAADLGKGPAEIADGRDQRYPRTSFAEVVARAPTHVLLPDEPCVFDAAWQAACAQALPHAVIVPVSGRLLFWPGAWAVDHWPEAPTTLLEPASA